MTAEQAFGGFAAVMAGVIGVVRIWDIAVYLLNRF